MIGLKDELKNIFKKGKLYLPLFLVLLVFFLSLGFRIDDVLAADAVCNPACVAGQTCMAVEDYENGGVKMACLGEADAEKQRAKDGLQGLQNKIIIGFSWIVYVIANAVGKVLTFVTQQLIVVAQWNHFIDIPVVITGWVILRDLCNMFFVLLLLMVAFATILRIDGYDIKKMVPKILIMAVLINFSKTICGLVIDASQIVMLTFVSGFADMGAAKFTDLMGISHMYEMIKKTDSGGGSLGIEVFAGIFGGLVASLIMFVVITVALVVFLVRVVYLWVYVMMSPLAFFASSFSQGKSYSQRWLNEFTQQVTAGPILAFFIWIALSVTTASTTDLLNKGITQPEAVISKFFSSGPFTTYIITIGLLVAGLMESKKVGGAIGAVAGKGLDYVNKGKTWSVNQAKGAAIGGAKRVGTGALGIVAGANLGYNKIFNRDADGKAQRGMVGNFVNNWRNDLVGSRKKASYEKRLKTLKAMGMGDKTMENVKQIADSKGGRIAKGVVGGIGAVGLAAFGAPTILTAIAGFVSALKVGEAGAKEVADSKKKGRDSVEKGLTDAKTRAVETSEAIRKDDIENLPEMATIRNEKNNEHNDLLIKRNDALLRNFSLPTQAERDAGREVINNKYGEELDVLVKKFDKRFEDEGKNTGSFEVNRVNKEHDARVEAANNDFTTGMGNNKAGFIERNMSDRHPNQVIIKAADLGIKDLIAAEARRNVLASGAESMNGFSAGDLYGASGQKDSHKNFYNKLNDGSTESTEALNKMVATLNAIKNGTETANYKTLEAWKKGIAGYKKGGGDVSKMSAVITLLNSTPHGDGSDSKHHTTVEEFESKIV